MEVGYRGTLDLNLIAETLAQTNGNKAEAARRLGVPVTTLKRAVTHLKTHMSYTDISGDDDKCVFVHRSKTIKTLDAALKAGEVDLTVWEVERWKLNKWDMGAKTLQNADVQLHAMELWQVTVWLQRKTPAVQALDTLLDELRNHKLTLPTPKSLKSRKPISRELEISIVDPHLGLTCTEPAANSEWNIDKCEQIVLGMTDELLNAADYYAPFKQIVFPLGNDFFHCDNLNRTTTNGTPLPNSSAWHEMILRGEKLTFAVINKLLEVAPVKVIVIPGNHDKHSTFMLGRVVNAMYHNAKHVNVVCDASPYKFHKFGVNIIGYIHGNGFPANRLAALMANETRISGWADARYCEWHLGDQHRKGSARPTVMEEQGVSIEYLPGLTPPDEWHKMNIFTWQKRAGMAFVWDEFKGPVARLQVNIDSYTGEFLGS